MSGYLRSLVSRAVPAGPRLRPIAVPFASAPVQPFGEEATEIAAAVKGPSGPQEPAPRAPVAAHVDAPRDRKPSPAAISIDTAVNLLTGGDQSSRELPPATMPHAAVTNVPAEPREHVRTVPVDLPRLGVSSALPATTPVAGPVSPPPARVTPIARDSHPRRTALDPPLAVERVERANTSSAAPPDVHIHIGRVEFTAVAAPSQPRRQRAAAGRPAMALDEYLKRRNEGTR